MRGLGQNAGKGEHRLHFGGERADETDAGNMNELGDLLEADFRFTTCDHGRHRLAGRRSAHFPALGRDLIGNAELLEQDGREIRAAATVRIGDGFRRQQCIAEGGHAADVGLVRAFAHHHADERARQFDLAIGLHQAALAEFVGRAALEKAKAAGLTRTLVGLEMTERGIARDGYKVLDDDGREIGYVTSGSPAPFLKKNIALAYVPPESAAVGTALKVEIRGQGVGAQVVPTPFYKRPKKNL